MSLLWHLTNRRWNYNSRINDIGPSLYNKKTTVIWDLICYLTTLKFNRDADSFPITCGCPHVTKTWEPRPLGLHLPVRNPVGARGYWSSLKVFLKCATSSNGFLVNRLLFCDAWNVSCHRYLLVRWPRSYPRHPSVSLSSFLLRTLMRSWLTAVPIAAIVLIGPIGNDSVPTLL